jgi:hypothetical protein
MDTGTRLFRPDDMCQKIVKLYVDLQEDVHLKMFHKKYKDIYDACEREGEEKIFKRACLHLMFKMFSNFHANREDTGWGLEEISSSTQLLHAWKRMIEDRYSQKELDFKDFMNNVHKYISKEEMTVQDMYEWMCEKANIPNELSKAVTDLNFVARVSYLVFLHFLILNNERAMRSSSVESVKDKLLKAK